MTNFLATTAMALCLSGGIYISNTWAQQELTLSAKSSPQDNLRSKRILLSGTPKDVTQLLSKGIDVNGDYGCSSLLNLAIQSLIGNENPNGTPEDTIEKIKILIKAGADVNKETCKMTPLAMTVTLPEQGRRIEKKFMKALNANINSSTGTCTVGGIDKPCKDTTHEEKAQMREELHKAFTGELKKNEPYILEIITLLLDHGADINQASHGVSPLLFAASTPEEGGVTILKFLLEKGANPNVQDFQGSTPLFVANFADNKEAIKLLIDSGADTTIRNNSGKLYYEFKTGEYYIPY